MYRHGLKQKCTWMSGYIRKKTTTTTNARRSGKFINKLRISCITSTAKNSKKYMTSYFHPMPDLPKPFPGSGKFLPSSHGVHGNKLTNKMQIPLTSEPWLSSENVWNSACTGAASPFCRFENHWLEVISISRLVFDCQRWKVRFRFIILSVSYFFDLL